MKRLCDWFIEFLWQLFDLQREADATEWRGRYRAEWMRSNKHGRDD